MIGMLYLNSAISYMNRSEPAHAYYQFEKAFILHPSSKTQYLLLAHLNNFLGELDYYNPRDLGYLIKASRLIGYGVTRERITHFLKDIIREVLINKQDTEGMQYIHDYMQEYMTDVTLKNDFRFLYHHETGRLQYNDQQYSPAMLSLETAYSLKPDDEHNIDLLARALGGYSLNADPGMVLEKISFYDSTFAGIVDHEIYLRIKQNTCLEFFGEAFQLQDGKNGEYYMAVFEEMAEQHPGNRIDYLAVGRSYSSAAIYYYRQGRIQKSREVLERGLKYAPHNVELKLKLKSFE
jgi:tetratricopeptide (TPR) repeat protein